MCQRATGSYPWGRWAFPELRRGAPPTNPSILGLSPPRLPTLNGRPREMYPFLLLRKVRLSITQETDYLGQILEKEKCIRPDSKYRF